MNLGDELQKLQQLHAAGSLSDEEFAQAKQRLIQQPDLGGSPPQKQSFQGPTGPVDVEQQTRLWAMLLHFSLLAGFVVPLGGLVVPIVIWQIKKNELPGIDIHGKMAINWIISLLIYGVVSSILVFAVIGIFLLMALGVVAIVFPIIAGVKANNGEVWKYPLAITIVN